MKRRKNRKNRCEKKIKIYQKKKQHVLKLPNSYFEKGLEQGLEQVVENMVKKGFSDVEFMDIT